MNRFDVWMIWHIKANIIFFIHIALLELFSVIMKINDVKAVRRALDVASLLGVISMVVWVYVGIIHVIFFSG